MNILAKKTKILVLGAGGMLGHVLFTRLSTSEDLEVVGTVRDREISKSRLASCTSSKIASGIDAGQFDTIADLISELRPEAVLNCIGIIKQLPQSSNPISSIGINSLLPHRIADECGKIGARLIHFSTDCVFDGTKGNYSETDIPNAADPYGRSKYLGEVTGPNCLTIRTSIIGHELNTSFGLVEWFLSQKSETQGFTKAIFSGFPTIEIANILVRYVIPNSGISGLYHISSDPISKYELLKLIAQTYGKDIRIVPSDRVNEDRSLDSARFRAVSGYVPPKWAALVDLMHDHYKNSPCYNGRQI